MGIMEWHGQAMSLQESRKHHFVPQFLIRQWAVGNSVLAYWWDQRRAKLAWKRRGPKSICFQIEMLTLSRNQRGRDALERIFFSDVDGRGATIREKLLSPKATLNADDRSEFGRLILSLEARRPEMVRILRQEGPGRLAAGLDSDPEILAVFAERGINMAPSEYAEQNGLSFEDRALGVIQKLVDNPRVGERLINANWHVVHIPRLNGTLLLGDRPLIRVHGAFDPDAVWVLPLSPDAVFFAANDRRRIALIRNMTAAAIRKWVNVQTVRQAERFVIAADQSHEHWIARFLEAGSQAPKINLRTSSAGLAG